MILNIGLDKVTTQQAIASIISMGIATTGHSIHQSDTEPTLVVSCDASPKEVYRLAVHLGEDCIAAYDPETGEGYLEGPRADAWGGRFIPEYFIMPDGSRLA